MSAAPVLPIAGFTILENSILLDPHISIEAKATLGLLRYFDRGNGRGCFARKETLCRFLAISPYRLRKALQELQDLGRITIHRRGQGHPDVIHVVRQDDRQGPPPLQVKEVAIEAEEDLDRGAEELPDRTPGDPPEESGALEGHGLEIQRSKISPREHYKEENRDKNILLDPLSTKREPIMAAEQGPSREQCENLISYFYETKEQRRPTHNELINWTPTARRLLEEFALDELKPAVKNAVAKGARLFYFVALTAPVFILGQRQQKQDDVERLKHATEAVEGKRQPAYRQEALRRLAAGYEAETRELLAGLEGRMRPQSYRTWFQEAFLVSVTAEALTLVVASPGAAEWISKSYTALLQEVSGKAHIKIIAG